MLRMGSTLNHLSIFNLRAGYPVAKVSRPLINPHNLKIIGFWIEPSSKKSPRQVLLTQDIREIIGRRIIIDDLDDIVEADDLVKLKNILEIDFELMSKKVTTESGIRLGKVEDYSVSRELSIVRIIVKRSAFKNPLNSHLSIGRNQIKKVTDRRIVVDDTLSQISKDESAKVNTSTANLGYSSSSRADRISE